jgi:cyclophilin family peptidyl-prolyl cis-trans isomerase
MSSLSRTVTILALAAAGLALVGCGGGGKHASQTTTGRTPLAPSTTYDVVMKTNEGSFTTTLDQNTSPHNTASFAALVRRGFFDGTVFHRIVPGFVIQGGDPLGTGMGGPGYTVLDRVPPGTRYTRGVVAMAKTAAQPAGTGGSQFFIVTGDDVGLPPLYAVIGKVTDGLDVVLKIGRLGNPSTQKPTKRVVIEHAELTTRG